MYALCKAEKLELFEISASLPRLGLVDNTESADSNIGVGEFRQRARDLNRKCFGCHGCVVVDVILFIELPLGSLLSFDLRE